MTTYLALTIGPIYKTMTMARKTREFWSASLLFSLLAQELCLALKAQEIQNEDFLVPHPDIFKMEIKDIGLYLDRIICKADDTVWSHLETNVIDIALENLSKKISVVDKRLTKDLLKKYFKIYAVFKAVDESKPLNEISNHLNTLEIFNINEAESETEDTIRYFLENVNTEYDNNNKIENNAIKTFLEQYFTIQDFNGNIRIPSITEISTTPIVELDKAKYEKGYIAIMNKYLWNNIPNENKIFPALKQSFPNQIKNHYKYIAILQADGDKLGSFLMESNAETVLKISKALINWCTNDALKILKNHKALPIYIGGDDVMCFAPVNNGDNNILDIAYALNQSFKKAVQEISDKSTLSISIKIAYYKSPMGENYAQTFPLLRENAKEYIFHKVDKNGTKTEVKANACAINLEKHSGQPHELIFNFSEEYEAYIKPIMDMMNQDENKKSFLTSVFYKIRANEKLLETISADKKRMRYFFDNNFDSEKDFLNAVCNYLFHLFSIYGDTTIDPESKELKATNYLYSALKIIRFIKGLDYDNE